VNLTQENVQEWLFSTSQAVTGMFRVIDRTNNTLRHFNPKRCAISTMTIIGKLSAEILFSDITACEDELEDHGLVIHPGGFMNQVTVKSGNASIKLFRNGTVQCTGSQSLVFFVECMDRLCDALDVTLVDAHIAMMNVNLHCRRNIPFGPLQLAGFEYNPDLKYSGAKLQTDENSTVKVTAFASGNITLSGSDPHAIQTAYTTVSAMLDTIFQGHPNMSAEPLITTKAQIKSYMIQHGYSSRLMAFYLQ